MQHLKWLSLSDQQEWSNTSNSKTRIGRGHIHALLNGTVKANKIKFEQTNIRSK